MAINPNLVSIIPASELPTGVPTTAGEFFFYEGNEMKKSPMSEIYGLVSDSQSIGTITPSSTIPAEGNIWGFAGEGTYTNAGNITVAAGKFAILSRVGTTWSKVEVDMPQPEYNSGSLNPTSTDKAETGKSVADYVSSKLVEIKEELDVSDLVIKAGQNVATILGTDSEIAPNVANNQFISNNGTEYSSAGYFISDYIKIEYPSLKYSTGLGTGFPAVCIYDANKTFIAGKNATKMTNTDTQYTERLLDADFDLTNAVYVRISCVNTESLIVKYDENIIINHTISTLEYGSDKPINSNAVKSIDTKVNEIYEVAKDVELLNNFIPYLEPAETFMRGYYGNANYAPNTTHSIVSRDNDYQLTTNITSHAGKQAYIVVFNGTKYFPIRVIDVNTTTGVMKTADALPSVCTNFQFLWGDGIHLSRYGYKAMAEWFVDNAILKNTQRKKRVFSIYTYDQTLKNSSQNFVRNGQTILAMNKLTASTVSGGWLDQANEILGTFELQYPKNNRMISAKFPNYWMMSQNVAGAGVKFTLPVENGYVRIVCGTEFQAGVIEGKVNIKAYDQNATEVYNQNLNQYGLKEIIIPTEIENETVTFEISLLSSTITRFTISEIEVVKTYLDNTNFIKENGIKIMFLCDSWGEFPNLQAGETGAKRADGTTMGGLAYFPNHTKTYLASQGIDSTIYNFSRGSQTSAWGNYWVDEFISRCPSKPDYCVVNFFINDNFSGNNVPNTPHGSYDFSPTDPYTFQRSDQGGVFGSVSDAMWVANMKSICKKLLAENITPIIIGFPQFGDVSVSMEQRNTYFLKNFNF